MGLRTAIPDLQFIRRSLPISDVARALDLRFATPSGIHCWHADRHKNGDRTASVSIWVAQNKIKCFGCDLGPLGPLDLVVDVLELTVREAIGWMDARFEIPRRPPGTHVSQPERPYGQYGYETELGLLIRSGIWAALSPSTQRLVPVLLEFAEPRHSRDERCLHMSYRALSRYGGVGSPNAVKHALNELEEIGWLTATPTTRASGELIRPTGTYRVTPFSDAVYGLANAVARETAAAITLERQLRQEQRTTRSSQFRTKEASGGVRSVT